MEQESKYQSGKSSTGDTNESSDGFYWVKDSLFGWMPGYVHDDGKCYDALGTAAPVVTEIGPEIVHGEVEELKARIEHLEALLRVRTPLGSLATLTDSTTPRPPKPRPHIRIDPETRI